MHLRILSVLVAAAAAAVCASGGEYPLVVDRAHSSVEVAVKVTGDSFVGKLRQFQPAIAFDERGRVTAARVAFHFADLETGKTKRDRAMHEWQQTESYPDGEFVLDALEPGSGVDATARGRLTLHGVTREVRFPVAISREGARYAIDGDVPVDTREFGLPAIRMLLLLKVDPVVHVRFHVQGMLANGEVAVRR